MIQTIRKHTPVALLALALAATTGCSDQFLVDKKLYNTYNEATVYANYETATNRVDYLYYQLSPGPDGTEGNRSGYNLLIPVGTDDEYAQCTEEYAKLSVFEDNLEPLDYQSINTKYDHFYIENKETSPYGHVREVNEVIEGLQKYAKDALTEEQYNGLLGQAYFLRAWRYYLMVRYYGGMPIIDHVQNAIVGNGEGLNLVVPRSSTKECIDFICADLDRAAKLLPLRWENDAKDWGRVTAGTALALKSRVLLLYASPLFNRTDNRDRWEAAYQASKNALDTLELGGFGLAYENNAGSEKASGANWGKIFLSTQGSDGQVNEAVFVTLYDNLEDIDHSVRWNSWEQSIRPKNAYGGGGKTPTAEFVDLFPMADGKMPGESTYEYDELCFFLNRDPRFYRTFAFPGVKWTYNGQTKDNSTTTGDVTYGETGITMHKSYPYNGNEYVLWSYCWYDTPANAGDPTKSGVGADWLGTSNAVYVRKRSDDAQLNGSPLYNYNQDSNTQSTKGKGFSASGTPYMEIRFAEVLLNYAEAAAATDRGQEAFTALQRIRSRVYDAKYAPNFGLDPSLAGNRAAMIAAILFERQIELAYEGKRFEDCRRWLLFDGGVGHEAYKDTWKVTGFGGNTCTYLGVQPLNQREKHHIIELRTIEMATAADNEDIDPLLMAGVKRLPGLNLQERNKNNNQGEAYLAEFYREHFIRKDRNGEGNNSEQIPTFQIPYYLMGFTYSGMVNNPTLYQNIGWEDFTHGGEGIFDPLEEDPAKIPVDTDTGFE